MAHQRVETNPHFIDPEQRTLDQRPYLPAALLPRRGHGHRPQDERRRPLGPSPPDQHHEGQPHLPLHVRVPPVHHEDQNPSPSLIKPQGESREHHPSPGVVAPQGQDRHPQEHRPHSSRFLPQERRTKPLTWFAAAFCIIFWLVFIIGGLIILILYLVFRPHSPRFDVSSVTLNAAYLDTGYLLNADLSVLANFTNPNKKVNVDFSNIYLHLYFENTRIATQHIEPFSAARGQSTFANIRMVTSQVGLSINETLLLQRQIENNRVMFTIKHVFRARFTLGGFLKYSYRLHGRCSILVSSPPTGVLIDKRCKTKQ